MNQENGRIKQLKLRVPMELFYQLCKDAEARGETPSARARHILLDELMEIDISSKEDKAAIEKLVKENWKRIKGE